MGTVRHHRVRSGGVDLRFTRIAITGGLLALGVALVLLAGQYRERHVAERRVTDLGQGETNGGPVRFSSFEQLPAPVARYFRHVLKDGQRFITRVEIRQAGELRTSSSADWSAFTARQVVVPGQPGFVWNARVVMPLGTHVRVLDSYVGGAATGRVSLLSAIPIAVESDQPKLNSGALHRYLAEAVWYPTALLPGAGVRWSPISESAALATLSDRGTTVALEFRFNRQGEVTGIFSPDRFGRFDGGYRKVAWEGIFRDYAVRSGVRVPGYGEVGWYDTGPWHSVWKGTLLDIRFEFEAGGSRRVPAPVRKSP